MKIVRISREKPEPRLIKEAAAVLKRGGLVVYPTETAYALGCDATNRAAVRRIYDVKRRDPKKPLPLIVGSAAMARRYARFDALSKELARTFWPGPLTLVLRAASGIARGAVSDLREVAMRVSGDPLARGLSAALGRPLVSTSANRSGGVTPYRLSELLAEVGFAPDFCLDAGALPKHPPSTVVRCLRNGNCDVLRAGPVSEEALFAALKNRQ